MSRALRVLSTGESRDHLPQSDRPQSQRRDHESKQCYKGISRKNPIGLRNFGNSCYFNSVLQSLSHTPAFHQELLKATYKGELINSFIQIAFDLIDGDQQPVNPSLVTNCFTTKVPRFENSEQHDSHECLRHFLEEIRKEERESKGSSQSNSQLTVVDKIFGGHLVTVYVCEDCDKHYHLFEPCLDISLPVFFEDENRKDENQTGGQMCGKNPDLTLPKAALSKHDYSEPMYKDSSAYSKHDNLDTMNDDARSSSSYNTEKPQMYGKSPDQKHRKDVQSKHDYSESMYKDGYAYQKHDYLQTMYDDGRSFLSHNTEKPQRSGGVSNWDSVKVSEIKSKTATDMTKKQKHCVDRNKPGYEEAIKTLMGRLSRIPDDPNSNSSAGEFKRSDYSRRCRPISLSDCFKHFSRKEQIIDEYLCEDCLREAMARGEADEDHLKLTSATKQTLIFNPPAILTIHFKRFELLPGTSRKRPDKVEYPKDLDIAPYCSSQCLRNDPPRNNICYSLYAVIVHSGSLEFGHYVAYVREKAETIEQVKNFLQNEYFNHNVTSEELIMMMQKKAQPKRKEREVSNWYLINDSNVRKAGIDEVLRQEAYLLFYERIP